MKNVSVSLNAKGSHFAISSPPWMVDVMRMIPNRRWDGKSKTWMAPVIRANAEYLASSFPPEVFTIEASKALVDCRDKKSCRPARRFPLSYQFKIPPMPHQLAAIDRAYGLDAFALFMQQRTGKTKVMIDTFCAHNSAGAVDSLVVVCPNDLKINWSIEFSKNATVDYSLHILESGKTRAFEKWLIEPHAFRVLVVATESLSSGGALGLVERFMLTSTRVGCLVDESHDIKNHKSIRTKACFTLRDLSNIRAIATGTPDPQGMLDYFAQFEFLDPNIIGVGDYYSFRNRYAVMGGFENKQIIGYQNTDELIELIAPHIISVKRKDVFLSLPEKCYEVRTVPLSKKQAELYQKLRSAKRVEDGDAVLEVSNVLTLMGRLQEITAGVFSYQNPDYDGVADKQKFKHEWIGSSKIDELMHVLEGEDGSVVVWAVYEKEIAEIARAIRAKYGDDQVVEVHGGIDREVRDHNVRNLFQQKRARFLVGNAVVGGKGHEMSAASTIIYMSNQFSYVHRSQSEDRASSVTQKNSVKIIDIMCPGTVDDITKEALDNKQDVSEYLSRKLHSVISRI